MIKSLHNGNNKDKKQGIYNIPYSTNKSKNLTFKEESIKSVDEWINFCNSEKKPPIHIQFI